MGSNRRISWRTDWLDYRKKIFIAQIGATRQRGDESVSAAARREHTMTNPAHAVLDRFTRFVQNELKMLEVVAEAVRDDDAT